MPQQQGALRELRNELGIDRAVVFIHGFSGSRDDTWATFPNLLGAEVKDWNIFTLGYATTLLPDVLGIWSADPDLPILADLLHLELTIPPLDRYRSVALVAHSMGGLVAQKALVDHRDLVSRISHLVLFGTPSGGLIKAGLARFWKRQLRNMARGQPFITELRAAWSSHFGNAPPFGLTVVAGTNDQFVPPLSALSPFDRSVCRVVPGDHLQIVKPKDKDAESVRLLCTVLRAQAAPHGTTSPLRLAAELGAAVAEPAPSPPVLMFDKKEVVDRALALERDGNRKGAMTLLQDALDKHPDWTDAIGTLAGRIKRIWLEQRKDAEARQALDLYQQALGIARTDESKPHDQIYYHAINVAFLRFVAFDNTSDAQEMAKLALEHCQLAPPAYWNTATQAEAHLYLGDTNKALELYRQAINRAPEDWMAISSGLQAGRIAIKLRDKNLAEGLEAIFTPGARKASKIFVSYSHRDSAWLERFHKIIAPYVKRENAELEMWTDRDLEPGDRWFAEITATLASSGVAVLFVSADFLASDFITTHELPAIMKAAKDGTMQLFWVYLSPAAVDAVELAQFQAAHDPSRPLAALAPHEQDQVLLDVAKKVKAAALVAAERFKGR